MQNKLTGNEPFNPCDSDLHGKPNTGATIRLQLAGIAMEGILASKLFHDEHFIARKAIQQADALIKSYNEIPNPNL